ncbi:hypothetical protein K1X76_06050 [bacterium]|nr:hypothetical protein [bacterium]
MNPKSTRNLNNAPLQPTLRLVDASESLYRLQQSQKELLKSLNRVIKNLDNKEENIELIHRLKTISSNS